MDPRQLLEQFLGTNPAANNPSGNNPVQAAAPGTQAGANLIPGGLSGVTNAMGGLPGGLVAGGLLGLLLGNKKARKTVGHLAGGVVGYGAAAGLGALAYRAYQNWQNEQNTGGVDAPGSVSPVPSPGAFATSVPAAGTPAELPPQAQKFLPQSAPAKDGRPFELALISAMIAAANADGHIDADEQRTIFGQISQMQLDAEGKAFVFDTLNKPPSLQDIANLAGGPEQAAELYLASRLAIDPDLPSEKMYLEALASRMSLPTDLIIQLEAQAASVAPA
jgi:uncharacterized membrane protein YebE (DUF533 family)